MGFFVQRSPSRPARTTSIRTWRGVLLSATFLTLAGCVAANPDPTSDIASAVQGEYRDFIQSASADLGPRTVDKHGFVVPTTEIRPGDGPVSRPAVVEDLPPSQAGSPALWQSAMLQPQSSNRRVVTFAVKELLDRALARSNQIAAFADVPLIRQTVIDSENGRYDPRAFVDGNLRVDSNRRSSTLETGLAPGAPQDLNEEDYEISFGVRQAIITGGEITVAQTLRRERSNSEFFVPNPQSTARWRVELSQPLLEGAGITIANAPAQIATLERDQSIQELQRQVETQLIEVIRSYWTLYTERARVILRHRLIAKLQRLSFAVAQRQAVDALPGEAAQARAALKRAEASLIRARSGVRNGEARLAALLSDPELFGEQVEIVPGQPPVTVFADVPLEDISLLALSLRPELRSAALQLRAAELRRRVARNKLLPELDAYVGVSNRGLAPGYRTGEAFDDQFSQTDPDVTVGVRLEVPLGNRSDRALFKRRELEIRQLTSQLRNVTDTLLLEAQIAVREVRTAYEEMKARQVELDALNATVYELGKRYDAGAETGSAFLNTYIQSIEQQGNAQERLLDAVVTYNLSLYTLERVAGTMLRSRAIGATRGKSSNLDYISIVRGKEGLPTEDDTLSDDIFTDPNELGRGRGIAVGFAGSAGNR